MLWMNLRRVFENGGKSFARSGAISIATVLIMTVTLIIIGTLIFIGAVMQHTLVTIEDKVDVNAYFVTTASEDQILAVKEKLSGLPEVADVVYTSREAA